LVLARMQSGMMEASTTRIPVNSGETASFDRVVPAHYGGEVTVVELLNIILSHSTHHLKQVYYFMENDLGLTLKDPATEADMEGIVTPTALI